MQKNLLQEKKWINRRLIMDTSDLAFSIVFAGSVFICCCTFIVKSIIDIKQERWKLEHKKEQEEEDIFA